MFLIDDLVLSPAKGFMWLCRELQKAAEQAQADDRDALMRRLQSLHMRLEAGEMTEDEFDAAEQEILDRLDEMDGTAVDDEDEEDDEEE